MKAKSLFFWSCIIISVIGVLVGTLGHLPIIARIITPAEAAAVTDFESLQNGRSLSTEAMSFPTFVKATKNYCSKFGPTVDWNQFRIIRFENRHSIANVPVFFAISNTGELLQLRFDFFQKELDSIITNAKLPLAIIIFSVGIFLMIVKHFFVNSKQVNTVTRDSHLFTW